MFGGLKKKDQDHKTGERTVAAKQYHMSPGESSITPVLLQN